MTADDSHRVPQGARSVAQVVTVDGRRCVRKRYNAYRDPPAVKLARELRFYRTYSNVPVLPSLVGHREPDTITIAHVGGKRLIDEIESERFDAKDARTVSAHYGEVLSEFFEPSSSAAGRAESVDYVAAVVGKVKEALERHANWRREPILLAAANLEALVDAAPPMLGKTDWSASNMLVHDGRVTCLYDFDTAYPGNRLTFLGDILCGASLHLDWPAIRDGLTSRGVAMPNPSRLATAAHFSRWQVQLARATPEDLGWPGPEQFASHLERLTGLVRTGL